MKKILESEIPPKTTNGFSLRSVLLLILLVGVAAGATVYAIANTFAANTGTSGTTQQSTGSTTATTGHNCTLASLGAIAF